MRRSTRPAAAVIAFVNTMTPHSLASFAKVSPRTRRAAVVSFVVGLLFVSGVALAEWLAGGTGSGYAKAATPRT